MTTELKLTDPATEALLNLITIEQAIEYYGADNLIAVIEEQNLNTK